MIYVISLPYMGGKKYTEDCYQFNEIFFPTPEPFSIDEIKTFLKSFKNEVCITTVNKILYIKDYLILATNKLGDNTGYVTTLLKEANYNSTTKLIGKIYYCYDDDMYTNIMVSLNVTRYKDTIDIKCCPISYFTEYKDL